MKKPMTNAANTSKGMLLIISGPSGVGKTTITHHVEKQLHAVFSVSVTTRPKRPGDREGVDYYFVDLPRFQQMRDTGQLLEWAKVFDHYYGTPRQPVEAALAAGKLIILEIDVQGAIQIKAQLPEAFAVFVLPPDEPTLLQRLRGRKREDESVIQERFARASEEIARAKTCGVYNAFVVNDDLATATAQTVELVRRELAARRQAPASTQRP